MDTAVTKNRIDNHLEYDWFKYVIILIAAIFLWSMVFTMMNANLGEEKLDFFVVADSEKQNNLQSEMTAIFEPEGIREINFSITPQNSESFSTLLQTRGIISSDVLVLPKNIMDSTYYGFVPFDDELVAQCVPMGATLDYYTNEEDTTKTKYGIRIDNIVGIKNYFIFDGALEEKDKQAYYLVVNSSSNNIGKYSKNKKDKIENDQAIRAIAHILKKATSNG